MSKRCELTGVGAQTGHKVSHSNHKAKRRFVPNIQNISFLSTILNRKISLRVTPATVRTVDHNGGLDNYLLTTSNLKLTDIAKKIKRKLKKALAEKDAANPEAEKPAKKVASKRPARAKRPAKKVKEAKVAVKKVVKKKVVKEKTATKATATKKTVAKKPASSKKGA
jgi:large subunit ribosomal protein L28